MEECIPFDLQNSPLEGTNLIEASAGTGKTYTLTGLFIRLVLEKGLLAKEILVVTFTEGATAELKKRIRDGLQAALSAVTEGSGGEGFFPNLVKRHHGSRWKALQRLEEALRQFDEAAIHTIHGFCGGVLQENAFEIGLPFGMELTAREEEIKEEILLDFWRRRFYRVSPLFFLYAQANNGSLEDLQRLIMDKALDPSLKILPDTVRSIDTTHQERAFLSSFHKAQKAWRKERGDVERILTSHGSLNGRKYRKASIPLWMEEMDAFFRTHNPSPVLPPSFSKFTTCEIRLSLKKSGGEWEHPFFKRCSLLREETAKLEQVFAARLVEIKKDLFDYMEKELVRRKEGRRILFFDDLLTRLWKGLAGAGGKGLLSQIRKRFRAALIDEFQDTDPLQYAIFKKIFDSPGKVLFMIGDPKQAIYGFRGADVFAYMRGARDAKSRFGLPQNWRSSPELIRATNTIFGNRERPFIYEEIPFDGAKAAPRIDMDRLTVDGKEVPPFHLWFWPEKVEGGARPISKEEGRRSVAEAVAWEIARLVSLGGQKRALLGDNALSAGDIAVLVRKNRDAALMQQHLSTLQIPSVLHSTGNIFDTHEARELERVLTGITGALSESRLMTALSTDMLGLRGDVLDMMSRDSSILEAWMVKMRGYHELWNRRGFYQMFRRLITEENIIPRLVSYPDGERRATNFFHLAELLHQTAMKEQISMEGLLKWLKGQRGHLHGEDHLLRLESDENAVKIMTIHKSKGLEFPVVFCPFSWDGSRVTSGEPFLFHDPERDRGLTLDLGSAKRDENRLLAEEETLSENLRLLYVALTRAKVCCYLVWGRFNKSATSAPAYLFHGPKGGLGKKVVGHTEQWVKSLDSKTMFEDLDLISMKARGSIHVSVPPKKDVSSPMWPRDTAESLVKRSFQGQIDTSWRIASFSSLLSGFPAAADWADRDEEDIQEHLPDAGESGAEAFGERSNLFSFPTGTEAGIFFHDILEHLDFTEQDPAVIRELVLNKLHEHGLHPDWCEGVTDALNRLVSVPLKIGKEAFSLSQISPQQRLNELAFTYPLKYTDPKRMLSLMSPGAEGMVQGRPPETLGRVTFSPFKGFMKGYIDLVFEYRGRYYLVDWKSNFLGNHLEDYGWEALVKAMDRGHYILQCRIYGIALHLYLKQRVLGYDYNTHFGGIFYIFLRGLGPKGEHGTGIYRDRPLEERMITWVTDLIP